MVRKESAMMDKNNSVVDGVKAGGGGCYSTEGVAKEKNETHTYLVFFSLLLGKSMIDPQPHGTHGRPLSLLPLVLVQSASASECLLPVDSLSSGVLS